MVDLVKVKEIERESSNTAKPPCVERLRGHGAAFSPLWLTRGTSPLCKSVQTAQLTYGQAQCLEARHQLAHVLTGHCQSVVRERRVEILLGSQLKVSSCNRLLLISHLLHLDQHTPVEGPQLTRVELVKEPEK